MNAFRPRRSVLYMPSSNERALEKAKTLPVDALILDLEDAVAPDAKATARANAVAAVTSGAYGTRELTIRINGSDSSWHADDLDAVAAAGPDAVVVPKVDSADEVRSLVASFDKAGVPEHTRLWAMIESPTAILHCEEIAAASDRLETLVIGTNDLVKDLYAEYVPDRSNIMISLQLAVLAARASGRAILDGVYNNVKDVEGFLAECAQARRLGMDGKTLIHPGQIDGANTTFAPSADAIAEARGIVDAWEAGGTGVVTYEGRMIESLHVEQARRTLTIADELRDA